MRFSTRNVLAVTFIILASPACAGDRAAVDANSPATPAGASGAAAAAAPAAGGSPQGTAPSAIPKDPAAVVAKVNGVTITAKDFDEATREFLMQQGAPPNLPDEQMKQVHTAVMDALVGTELAYQKSQAEGIKVSQKDVDEAVAESKKNFPDEAKWEENMKAQGIDKDAFLLSINRNLAINKLIQTNVFEKITVTDADAKAYYDQHPQEMQKPEEVRASHILVRLPQGTTDDQKKAAKARIDEAAKKAKAGEDFAALAKTYSQDPGSAEQGGDLGFFPKGKMVPAFDAVAFTLKVGQISDVVETQFGYHVIKVTDRHAAQSATYDEVGERLKSFLKQRQARTTVQTYLKGLRDSAKVEIF
ncbi:MAG: peptidylprolyl isomerase [Acidobacteria bacterium]|nr:peptidylprolyl isomerase [Acidobacteriota bacterium]